MVTGRMVLEPAEGAGCFKRLGEVGAGRIAIPQIHGESGAVLGIARGGTHLGPLRCRLIPLRFHIEENAFLKGMGAVAAEQTKIHTVGCGGLLKSPERGGRIGMELNPRLHRDQFGPRGLWVGKVSEQATVGAGGFLDPFHHHRWG